MSVIKQIRELITPHAAENADAWAARWIPSAQQHIASEVVQSITALTGGELDQLTPETHLHDDLGLNELQHVELMLDVERKFNLEISNQDDVEIQTIAQLVQCVHAKPGKPEARNHDDEKG